MLQINHSVEDNNAMYGTSHNDQRQTDRPVPDSTFTIQDGDNASRFSQESKNATKINNSPHFQAREIELIVGEVLSERLGEVHYDPAKCKRLSQELAAHIMDRIMKDVSVGKYKMVAIVSIGSQQGVPGMRFGSRCLWDKDTDLFASVKFTNGSVFAVAMVYGMYFE